MTQLNAFQAARREADMVTQLRALFNEGRVPEKDYDFVASLLRAAEGRGLSVKQAEWVNRLLARFTAPPSPAGETIAPMSGVVELLTRARENGLKFPKLWLKFGPNNQDLRITVAGEKSKTPGWLVLTDGESFGNNKYYGRISPEGQFQIGRDGHDWKIALVDILGRLAEAPATVAAEYGHLTGHCCFCSLSLTDERSTAVGYGRTCAGKFGLPWGEKT